MKKTIGSLVLIFLLTSVHNSYSQVDTTGVNALFSMDLSDLMNQEVITASKFVQRSAEAASSISVITADDIKNFSYSTLGEALNSQRGIFLTSDRNYLYTGSRGFSRPTDYNNRIVVMIDGHIMNEVVYGSGFMGNELPVNMQDVEKIEIIRGPGASLYGSGAMLNVINVIMKKATATDHVILSAGTGSFSKNEFSAGYRGKIKNFDISVSGTGGLSNGEDFYFPELDSPETNGGISREKDWEKYTGLTAGIEARDIRFSGSYSFRNKGIPTGAWETDLDGNVFSTDERYYIESAYTKELKMDNLIQVKAYYDGYNYKGAYPSGGIESYDGSKGSWAGTELQYYTKAGKNNTLITGAEYKYIFKADYREWNNTTTLFSRNFPYSFFSAYLHDQYTINSSLSVTAGLRYDHYSVFGQSVSPRASIVYDYSKASSVKLLYNEAFRIPNIYESFYESEGAHKSNPDIKPEKIRALELTWGHEINRKFYTTMSLYSFTMKNLIDQIQDETDGLTVFRNLSQANGTGAEVELRYRQSQSISGFTSISLQKTLDPESGEALSNSPSFLVKSGVVFPVLKILKLSPEFYYESARNTISGNSSEDHYLFNLTLGTVRFLKYFEFNIKARNLFDSRYYYPGGFEHVQDMLPQERRNLFFRLNASF